MNSKIFIQLTDHSTGTKIWIRHRIIMAIREVIELERGMTNTYTSLLFLNGAGVAVSENVEDVVQRLEEIESNIPEPDND